VGDCSERERPGRQAPRETVFQWETPLTDLQDLGWHGTIPGERAVPTIELPSRCHPGPESQMRDQLDQIKNLTEVHILQAKCVPCAMTALPVRHIIAPMKRVYYQYTSRSSSLRITRLPMPLCYRSYPTASPCLAASIPARNCTVPACYVSDTMSSDYAVQACYVK